MRKSHFTFKEKYGMIKTEISFGGFSVEFTIRNIEEARERIRDYMTETPLLRIEALDPYLGCWQAREHWDWRC